MRATKRWNCDCGCGGTIEPGEKMVIRGGSILRADHAAPDALEEAGIGPRREIVKPEREVRQRELSDLPLFNLEYQHTEQTSLF